jgi:uncharacterized membrane-anchored protein
MHIFQNIFTRFLIVLGAQLGIIVTLFWSYGLILAQGREVTLRIVPVDPRSIFQGDYLTLSYEISRIQVQYYTQSPYTVFDVGDEVYIPLTQDYANPNLQTRTVGYTTGSNQTRSIDPGSISKTSCNSTGYYGGGFLGGSAERVCIKGRITSREKLAGQSSLQTEQTSPSDEPGSDQNLTPISNNQIDTKNDPNFFTYTYTLQYGIEQKYIAEGKGKDFNPQGKEVTAKIVIGKDSKAVLKDIYVDGKKF